MRNFVFLLLIAILFSSCGPSGPSILGIWRIDSMVVGPRNLADGLGFFHFKENGICETRASPGDFQEGKYKLEEDIKRVTLIAAESKQSYNYEIEEDKLSLNTILEGGQSLNIILFRTEELPVTKEEELGNSGALPPQKAP